ncbi:MAG: polyamine aminopropyltransferase [Sterolibacteriaceae bacterium]|uniref:Polyamine aminopropyltransferase n=1 Tax=Candidatus Methylophosphatis roskildensis TaxID=2899263 RepID=A0A9D7E182_9PROT|nr:polyamine aminopropyltransferase [Candidatus Methylophosphatis roskildensis]MBK7234114.1 polyamine aminopropyltransferase [Sterolibacteriaceae bacterium]
MIDRILILSVFIVASCGLAYELIAGALSSYLLGDSVLQFSSIIGCYLFAMGVGAHLSKYVRDEDVLARFVDIELLVGLLGGLSATALFLTFSWLAAPFRTTLYALVFAIGVLVGMEIPLVMRALHARSAQFSELVAKVLTFDYLGALAVSLLFPLVLAPRLGLSRTGLLFGMLNVAVGLWTIRVFRKSLPRPGAQVLRGAAVFALLGGVFLVSDRLVTWAEKGLFGDEIVHAVSTPYQRLVITRWQDDLRLYINGNLQFSSRDEHRYHEALVHPALESAPWARSVLVLGGGDGLALREVLKYPNVESVTLVDLDAEMTRLFSTSAPLTALNHGSLADPRVTVINQDAAQWIEHSEQMFDAAIVDFPDPSSFALGKLYSVPFYRLLARRVAVNGYVVVQSTSPYFAPRAYWSIVATLAEAGFRTWPYHAYVPSFGEWGFVLASLQGPFSPPQHYRIPMRFLDAEVTRGMFAFAPDMPRPAVEANRLNNQSLVHYFEQDWHRVIR